MWVTGFDVPSLDTIYIDKPVQRHNLIQTISRVNRKFANKEKGLVVDYIGIKRQMDLALAHYSNTDGWNMEGIEESIGVVKNYLNQLGKLFHKFDKTPYFSGDSLQQLECLNMAAEFVQVTEEIEKRFMMFVKRLKTAYDICSGSEEINQDERNNIHFYIAIRSIVFKLTKGNAPDTAQMNAKVRDMVKEALLSDGVEEVLKLCGNKSPELNIFDDDYLSKIKGIKLPNTKFKLLQLLLTKEIEYFKKINKVKGINFSEKLSSLVEKYNQREEQDDELQLELLDDLTDKMFDLFDELKEEHSLDIDLKEKAFYDILKELAHKRDFNYPDDRLILLSREVKSLFDDEAKYPDWYKRPEIKAALKSDLILLLEKYGYPFKDYDEVYNEVFEQAENFEKYNTANNELLSLY